MAVIFVLCYSAINAIAVEFASKVGLNYEILGYQLATYLCVLCVNIGALRACRRGIHFSTLHKYFALYVVAFIFLSIKHYPDWISKDFLYLLFMVLPSNIIFLGYINCIIYSQKFFITPNLIALFNICVMLIILIPDNIPLRASLPHLNANTYSTFGAYLMLGIIAYRKEKVENYALALPCAVAAIAVLSYANSVGITLILFAVMVFAFFTRMSLKSRVFHAFSFFLLIGAFCFSRFNNQNIRLIDRAETLVSNHSSTLYDRLFVYKYAGENFWNHFFVGSLYSLPDIHTAHNILIEIFLITGFFGVIIFCYFVFISFSRWSRALISGNQSLIFIALLYFFSFFESLFRGRFVYSVLLIALMAASFDRSFVKYLSPKKEKS
jgi:hypothetical protein